MRLSLQNFDYDLPKNLIAQTPMKPRDQSRLLVLHKKSGRIEHRHFFDLPGYLRPGDVLVLNNTKVMPARLIGKRAATGGKVEIFLLKEIKSGLWQCLVGGQRRKENLQVEFNKGLKAEIIKNNQDGTWNVKFNKNGAAFMKIVKQIGRVPLPPYIKSFSAKASADKANYQTVYANATKLGSVAAPTAGFHFTPALLKKIKNKGVQIEYITLQVGLGTFAPVKAEDITKHKMHVECVEINKKTLANIIKAKSESRRIIAVGTTSVRTLESLSHKITNNQDTITKKIPNLKFQTNIFIYPGYKFKLVDAMITNFHLPKSTLVMLVSAFAGRNKIFKAYSEAIKKKYRFFSYGDAMLIF